MPDKDDQTSAPANGRAEYRAIGHPTAFQIRMLWTAITALSLLTIAWVALFSLQVLGQTLQFLQPVLVPLAFAGILAYLLEPLIKKLTERGTPRYRAMVMVFTVFHLSMIFLFISVVVPTIGQVSNWVRKWPDNKVAIMSTLEREVVAPLEKLFASPPKRVGGKTGAEKKPADQQEKAAPPADEGQTTPGSSKENPAPAAADSTEPPSKEDPVADSATRRIFRQNSAWLAEKGIGFVNISIQGFMSIIGYLVGFILVPVYLYYFLKESTHIKENWSRILPLRQSEFKTEVISVLGEINGYLIAFFRGQMLVSLIDGVLVGVSLFILGLPYATIIGLCVALFGLLPYVGHALCWIAAVTISLIHFSIPSNMYSGIQEWWVYPLIVSGIFLVVMKLDGLVFGPKIIGDAVGLHPLTVIFGVLFWSLLLGGFLGPLLAVPLSAAVKVLFRRYVWSFRPGSGYEVS